MSKSPHHGISGADWHLAGAIGALRDAVAQLEHAYPDRGDPRDRRLRIEVARALVERAGARLRSAEREMKGVP